MLSINATLCGTPKNCICNVDSRRIKCEGFNVKEIPIFTEEEKENATFLDIIDTQIRDTTLYPFWKSLEFITFIDNTLLECDKLPETTQQLHVTSNCLLIDVDIEDPNPLLIDVDIEDPHIEDPPLKSANYFNYKLVILITMLVTFVLILIILTCNTSIDCKQKHHTHTRISIEDEETVQVCHV